MNIISLVNTIPEVFASVEDLNSEVWRQQIQLEKGCNYLFEANSGTGKSSLLSYLYGFRRDYQGQFLFDDVDISSFNIKKWTDIRKKTLSLLWQELRLFPELTAWENVVIKNNITKFQNKKTIETWFEQLGIDDKREAIVDKMSFGQQQRVALIRALCQPFDFIMVDEPISHLDSMNADVMAEIISAEAKRQGAAVIVTSIGKRLELQYDHIFKL